jgi:hypothetical protein
MFMLLLLKGLLAKLIITCTLKDKLTTWLCLVEGEGPKRRTREGGGSEWEPIKILFKNSAYEPKFIRAAPQASLAKFT